jgi:hypothetical protein
MSGKRACALRLQAVILTVGKPPDVTRALYQQLKREYKDTE